MVAKDPYADTLHRYRPGTTLPTGTAAEMTQARVIGLFGFLTIVWGLGFVAVKAGLGTLPPVAFAVLRFVIGAGIMTIYVFLVSDYRIPLNRKDWLAVLASALLMFTVYPIALYLGQQYVSSAIASVVSALIPLFTPALALALLNNTAVTLRDVAGVALGFVGTLLVIDPSTAAMDGTRLTGLVLLITAAAVFALGGVTVKRIQPTLPNETLVAWSMALGSIGLMTASVARNEPSILTIDWTAEAVIATVFLGVVVTAFGYFVYFELLDHLSPVEVNLAGYLMPAAAAVGGFLWLNETITYVTITGFVVIFIGFYTMKTHELHTVIHRLTLPTRGPAK